MKYLVYWKGFTGENNTQKKEEDLENAKEAAVELVERIRIEIK